MIGQLIIKYDRLNIGIDMKKHGVSLFVPPQHASQCTLPKKPTEIHW